MTTELMEITHDSVRSRLIEREKRFIQEAERMNAVAHSPEAPWGARVDYAGQMRRAKHRLKALMAGLLPVRISGRYFSLETLIWEGQSIPTQIVMQAQEARMRVPGGEPVVYGWDQEALPAERRRRDPVLCLLTGGSNFFLGFWLEVEVPDEQVPEFFGLVAPWAPKRGRGRPRKIASPRAQKALPA